MDRPAKIASIIAQRQPLVQKIEQAEHHLQSLASALNQLEEHRNQLLESVDDPQVQNKLKDIELLPLQPKISTQVHALAQLKSRFSRNTLNIGVVGEISAGKSTLLKTLSGLSNDEIPANKGGACTAVRSKITNQTGETKAEVFFHSEDSFLREVIYPYYEKLGLGQPPTSLDEFADSPLPKYTESSTLQQDIYRHLKEDYYQNLPHIRELLKLNSPQIINKSAIKDYVAQKRNPNTRELISYNHLAIKEVNIFCPFAQADVEQITLIDLPGMGDTLLGDKKLMLESLGKEVDIVIFVKRPDPIAYYWGKVSLGLYALAQQVMKDLGKRAFILLNHVPETDNLEACRSLQQDFQSLESEINFKSVRCDIANCDESVEIKAVFDQILDYLANNIAELDQGYALSCENALLDIQREVREKLDSCCDVFGQDLEDNYQEVEELFSELFGDDDSGWWREIVLGLQGLRKDLWDYREVPDPDLEAAVAAAAQACEEDRGILSSPDPITEINDQIKLKSALRAYPDYQDELRVLISHHYLTLDDGLHESLEKVKARVVDILIEKGKLGNLVDSQEADFLSAIANIIPGRREKLKEGFEIIANFEISYRSMILPRIRKYLDGLTNISATAGQTMYLDESEDKTLEVSKDTTAEDILTALEIDYEKAVNRIKPALEDLLKEPSQAAYAMVEEFVDNVIRQKGIKQEWKNFLRTVRGKIWTEEFGKAEREKQMRQEWLNVVNQVAGSNNAELFRFTK